MIPIMPDGEVKILEDIPLDNSYTHTISFQNALSQASYFRLNAKMTLDNVSYMRATGGSLKIQAKIEDVYNCNYMMFQNSNFEGKWFYAFIINAEYVNNITTQIWFEIDVMQTWMFDYTLGECYVEREHSVTDNAGDNIIPEKVTLGEYSIENPTKLPFLYDRNDKPLIYYGLWVCSTLDGSEITPYSNAGYLCGAQLLAWSPTTFAQYQDAGKADAIIAFSALPLNFVTLAAETPDPTKAPWVTFTVSKNTYCYKPFDGYTPKNKKLYTYPYNFLSVNGFNGNESEYAFEFFNAGDSCPLVLMCTIEPECKLGIAPRDYNGQKYSGDGGYNWAEMTKLYTFPQLPYSVSAFKNQLGNNIISSTFSVLSSTLSGAVTAGVPGAAVSGGLSLINQVGNLVQQANKPAVAKGSWDNLFLLANGLVGGWYCRKHIKKQFAEIIDNFFDMFGYATQRVKVPNTDSRPHWNYVKTLYCMLNGDVPEYAASAIRDNFNRGITFWKNPGEIGNYSLDNSPT